MKFVLGYSGRTREEMLTNYLLSNINPGTCQKVAKSGLNITHFVMGVSYGGSCSITFKQKLRDLHDYLYLRFKLTITIGISFLSATIPLIDISSTKNDTEFTDDLELEVDTSVCKHYSKLLLIR